MSDEVNKKVFIGDSGTKAEVSEVDRDPNNTSAHYTRDLMRKAGDFQAPIGSKYLGSAVVHYYSKDGMDEESKSYFSVCQCDVRKVDEGHADMGWKMLKSALMKAYGRSEPSSRDN